MNCIAQARSNNSTVMLGQRCCSMDRYSFRLASLRECFIQTSNMTQSDDSDDDGLMLTLLFITVSHTDALQSVSCRHSGCGLFYGEPVVDGLIVLAVQGAV